MRRQTVSKYILLTFNSTCKALIQKIKPEHRAKWLKSEYLMNVLIFHMKKKKKKKKTSTHKEKFTERNCRLVNLYGIADWSKCSLYAHATSLTFNIIVLLIYVTSFVSGYTSIPLVVMWSHAFLEMCGFVLDILHVKKFLKKPHFHISKQTK